MAVPTKTYPLAAPVEVESLVRVEFEFTKAGNMCQIHVTTSKRYVTLNPGSVGEEQFKTLWNNGVPNATALQAIFDAVPDLTPEERGVAVAAPEEPV